MGMGIKLIYWCDFDLRIGCWSRTVKYHSSEQNSGGTPSITRHTFKKINSITASLAWNYLVRFCRVNCFSEPAYLPFISLPLTSWSVFCLCFRFITSNSLYFQFLHFPLFFTVHILLRSKLKNRVQKTFSRTPPRGCWSLSSCLLYLNLSWHRPQVQSTQAQKCCAQYWIIVTSVHFTVTRILKIRV